jgi:putative transposase
VDAVGFAPTFPVSYTWAREGVRPLLRYEAPRNRRVNAFGADAPCGPQARFV